VRRFYLDTNVIISAVERVSPFGPVQEAFFARIDRGETEAVTSELTIMECLVRPLRERNAGLAGTYADFLAPRANFAVRSITRDILVVAAAQRAHNGTRLADAIHVATAMEAAADAFVSNDRRLRLPPSITMEVWDAIQ
jgi:predicted nucleic acid-binding protein